MTTAPLLKSVDSKAAIDSIANAFGLDAAQTGPAVDTLAEAITNRMQRKLLSRGGIADLVGLLGSATAPAPAPAPAVHADAATLENGNHILDVLIGNKHVSRGIAGRAAKDAGIDAEVAKKMLPVVANLMVGNMQREAQPQMSKLLRDMPVLAATSNGSPLPIPGDDIPGVGRKAPRDQPQSQNPFENLPDIIRRGGTQVPGGGSLEAVIGAILASLLGTKNRGVVGTLIQAFVLRWIVNLVRRFFTGGAVRRA